MRKVLGWFLLFVGIFFVGRWFVLSSILERKEDSHAEIAGPESFLMGIKAMKNEALDLTPENCAAKILFHTEILYNLPTNYFAPRTPIQVEYLKKEGLSALKDMFDVRFFLRQKIAEFDKNSSASLACVNAVRRAFHVSRYAEEFLSEWLQVQGLIDTATHPIFGGEFPHTTWGYRVNEEERPIQSGDVLMIMGKSVVSGMITQIGDEVGSFSHLAMVGESEKGELYIVEALIQFGAIMTPLKEWLMKAEDSRAVLLRFQDPDVARKAGRRIFSLVRDFKNKNKETIPYDFAMDSTEHQKLFCAEVPLAAYALASEGQVILPKFPMPTKGLIGTGYLEALGIKTANFMVPSDLDVDPRFKLIGEYRNLSLTRKMRIREAIIRSAYIFMKDKGYRFDPSIYFKGKSYAALGLRYMGLLKDELPTYMPATSVEVVLKMSHFSAGISDLISKWEDDYFKSHGHSVTYKEIIEKIDEIRQKDCLQQEEQEKKSLLRDVLPTTSSLFHWYFRSKKGCF